jgi:hypothetical protein
MTLFAFLFSPPRCRRQSDAAADDHRVRSRIAIVPSLLLAVATISTAVGGGLGGGRDIFVVTAAKLHE